MIKIYEQFPEILSLKSRVISKNYDKNKTYLNLDKTIFMPHNPDLYKDEGYIDGKRVIDIEEKNGKIVHTVEGKVNRRDVILKLDKDIRYKNLTYASCFSLFKIFFDSYYLPHKLSFKIEDDKGLITIENLSRIPDSGLLEEQINYAIDSGLKLERSNGIVEIPGIGKTVNNLICYDRAYKIKNFKILYIEKEGSDIKLSFRCG